MSKKRMHDTEIWEEDWFCDLPMQYKLFFLFIKDRCDHAGIWRVNKRSFTNSVPGQLLMLDDFLSKINSDPEKPRIIVLENGRWFIPRLCAFQYGKKFNIDSGVWRGALKRLIINDIPLSILKEVDFGFLQELDKQALDKIAYAKSMATIYYEYAKGWDTRKEEDKEKDKEKDMKGVQGENVDLTKAPIYVVAAKPYEEVVKYFPTVKEADFKTWVAFVQTIEKHSMQEIFVAKFVSPRDWSALYHVSGFKEDKWYDVLKKLLSTGVKPEQNLFFRIPEYMGYLKNGSGPGSNLDSGGGNNTDQMDKW